MALPESAEPLLDDVEQRVHALEARWSRFRPESELCRLNAAAGAPSPVSPETCRVLRHAVEGHQLTDGIFDPRVIDALEAAGYGASHETLDVDCGPLFGAGPFGAGPAMSRLPLVVEIDDEASRATLPIGERWDLGGIGKGFAADLITEDLAAAGVDSIMVNLGGDIRVFGEAPGAPCWTVQFDDPSRPGCVMGDVHLVEGGVATSSRAKRRWVSDGRSRHHVIDPRTSRPAETDLVAVTVVAAATWWAEVLAKSALVLGREAGRALVERHGCSAAFVDTDGALTVTGEHIRTDLRRTGAHS